MNLALAERIKILQEHGDKADYLALGRELFPDYADVSIWRIAKGKRWANDRTGLLSLTRYDVRNIQRLYNGGMRVSAISERLGVKRSTIQHIINKHPLWCDLD